MHPFNAVTGHTRGGGTHSPLHPLCTTIILFQKAKAKQLINTTCQLPYPPLKTVQRLGATSHSQGLIATIQKNAGFINRISQQDKRVIILSSSYQGIYYDLSNTAAINPGFCDIFLWKDYKRILYFLNSNQTTKIFFDLNDFSSFDPYIPIILSTRYNVNNADGNIYYFTLKPSVTDHGFILSSDNHSVLHVVLDNKHSPLSRFAEGITIRTRIGKRFSLEALFKPQKIHQTLVTSDAAIVFKGKDSYEFALTQMDTVEIQYIFVVCGQRMICSVIPGKWNYLSIEVDTNLISGFSNLQKLIPVHIKEPYNDIGGPLFIGNIRARRGFFFGDIKELKITNSIIDKREIEANWDIIKGLVN